MKTKLRIKIINYFDKHLLAEIDAKDYDVIIVANTYEQEFIVVHNNVMEYDSSVRLQLIEVNSYILDCYDAYNGVSELNLHKANTNRSWI
ncbi:MAG: hypothetical protein DRN27_09845 [Thermoplasmata archaeon]|nr:MAG: hypothetical protein DRN27_09845 [Thermoplasmata archaeon]